MAILGFPKEAANGEVAIQPRTPPVPVSDIRLPFLLRNSRLDRNGDDDMRARLESLVSRRKEEEREIATS